MSQECVVENDWKGLKGRFWSSVFKSRTLRYILGFYIFSNKHAASSKKVLKEVLPEGGHVVDLGAGSGYYTVLATNINNNVRTTAVEISGVMLEKLKKEIQKRGLKERVTVLNENIEHTSIPSNSADLIILSNVLHEVVTPTSLIEEMNRILKKDGVILASEFYNNDFGRKFLSHHNDDVHGPYNVAELRGYFRAGNFSNIEINHHRNRLLAIVKK